MHLSFEHLHISFCLSIPLCFMLGAANPSLGHMGNTCSSANTGPEYLHVYGGPKERSESCGSGSQWHREIHLVPGICQGTSQTRWHSRRKINMWVYHQYLNEFISALASHFSLIFPTLTEVSIAPQNSVTFTALSWYVLMLSLTVTWETGMDGVSRPAVVTQMLFHSPLSISSLINFHLWIPCSYSYLPNEHSHNCHLLLSWSPKRIS